LSLAASHLLQTPKRRRYHLLQGRTNWFWIMTSGKLFHNEKLALVSTHEFLARARQGDDEALDQLFSHYLPLFRRWAHGRLPLWARDLLDTEDIVQETLLYTIRNIDSLHTEKAGDFQAYVRQGILNKIRDEIRRVGRRPKPAQMSGDPESSFASPLEEAVGTESLERYEKALASLQPGDREAIVARIEMGMSYSDLAVALGKPSPDAARMAVSRALLRMAEEMKK
jgi:RNA polymerase sigma-70 factor (ECF subfamily)